MRRRLRKQVTVVAVVVAVVGGLVALVTLLLYEPLPPPPSPPPTFEALQVRETKILGAEDGRGDLYALVKNQNPLAGARSVNYVFELRVGTAVAASVPGTTFILPGQEKVIVALNQSVPDKVTDLEIRFSDSDWVIVPPTFREAALVPVSRTTRELPGTPAVAMVKGVLANESDLDYLRVEVTAVGRDAAGEILGVGKTFLGSLLVGERREFTVSWPLPPGRSVTDTRIFPEVNLLSSSSVQPRTGTSTIDNRQPILP